MNLFEENHRPQYQTQDEPASSCRLQRWSQIFPMKGRSEDISHRPSTVAGKRASKLPSRGNSPKILVTTAIDDKDCKNDLSLDYQSMTQSFQTPSVTRCMHREWKSSIDFSSKPLGLGFLQKCYIDHDKSSSCLKHRSGPEGIEDIRNNPRRLCLVGSLRGEGDNRGCPCQKGLNEAIYLPINLRISSKRFVLRQRPKQLTSKNFSRRNYPKLLVIAAISNDDCKIPSTLDCKPLQTPTITRQTNLCDKIFITNYSSSLLGHKFRQKSYTDLDKVSPTELYANATGIKHLGKYLRTLHLPRISKREDKGCPEKDRFDQRIYLPTNLMKSSGKFLLKPRYDAHPFFPRMMYTANSNDDCKIPSTLDHHPLQTPPPTRQINLCEEILTPNYSGSPLEHKFPLKSSTELDAITLTELYASQTGFKHLRK